MTSEVMGWQKYLYLRPEETWGVQSASADLYVPYTDYSVSTRVEANQASLFTGLRQRRHNRVQRATVTGSLSMPLFGYHVSGKSLAQYLIEWGLSGADTPFLPSYTAEIFEGDTDNKRHLGLRVSSLTLSGDADGGIVSLSMDLEGKEEVGGITPPDLDVTQPQPVEFLFDDVAMYLSDESEASSASGDDEAVDLRSFQLTIDNSLQVYHTNSYFPTCLAAGVRAVSFQFSIFKKDNTYDLLRRTTDVASKACRLVLRGRHLGTAMSGTYTEIQIHFDRLSFSGATDNVSLNDLISQDVDWIPLKPDTLSDDVDVFFSVS